MTMILARALEVAITKELRNLIKFKEISILN
jgi:hypothetical protein